MTGDNKGIEAYFASETCIEKKEHAAWQMFPCDGCLLDVSYAS
jgi:hypothetical protein